MQDQFHVFAKLNLQKNFLKQEKAEILVNQHF